MGVVRALWGRRAVRRAKGRATAGGSVPESQINGGGAVAWLGSGQALPVRVDGLRLANTIQQPVPALLAQVGARRSVQSSVRTWTVPVASRATRALSDRASASTGRSGVGHRSTAAVADSPRPGLSRCRGAASAMASASTSPKDLSVIG
jgi:hypothetical protein